MKKLYNFLFSYLKYLGPDKSHAAMLGLLRAMSYRAAKMPTDETLFQNLWGREVLSPVGLAAGYDKNAIATGGYFHLGFGFVELGTVVPEREGKETIPKYTADINRKIIKHGKSVPSVGHHVVGRRLASFRLADTNQWGPVGINIGPSKEHGNVLDGFRSGVAAFGGLADFITLNLNDIIPSLNSPAQDFEKLEKVLKQVMSEREEIPERLPAVFVKLPLNIPRENVGELARIFKRNQVNGIIIGNAIPMEMISKAPKTEDAGQMLSGSVLKPRALQMVSTFYQQLGENVTIIGSGGVFSGQDAYEFIQAGASLVQICSAFILEGPTAVTNIFDELSACLKADGYENISQAIGKKAKEPIGNAQNE